MKAERFSSPAGVRPGRQASPALLQLCERLLTGGFDQKGMHQGNGEKQNVLEASGNK